MRKAALRVDGRRGPALHRRQAWPDRRHFASPSYGHDDWLFSLLYSPLLRTAQGNPFLLSLFLLQLSRISQISPGRRFEFPHFFVPASVTPDQTTASMSTEESPAQQAARLRRERREAKIRATGSARLDKITSLSGRPPASGTVSYLESLMLLTLADECLSMNRARKPCPSTATRLAGSRCPRVNGTAPSNIFVASAPSTQGRRSDRGKHTKYTSAAGISTGIVARESPRAAATAKD